MDELAGVGRGCGGILLYVQHVEIFTNRNLRHPDNRSINNYINSKLGVDNRNDHVYNSLNKSPCYIYH
jgi:hypothetical protein